MNELKVLDYYDMHNALAKRSEDRYGVKVQTCDVTDPNTGDFDGTHILLDYEVGDEMALFILVHLFGHTVQWNVSEDLRKLGQESAVGNKNEEEMKKIFEYEREATRYGIQLMNESGVVGMDRWASDWFYADWLFLKHFYTTGEKLDSQKLFKAGAGELLAPLAIPEFKAQKFVSRYSF